MRGFILFFILTTMFVGYSQGQTTINFGYDAIGNRVHRGIDIYVKSLRQGESSEFKKDSVLSSGFKITVYPNPTAGDLTIELQGEIIDKLPQYYLYDTKGSIMQQETLKQITNLNLGHYTSGVYYLKVLAGKEINEWKIIKE